MDSSRAKSITFGDRGVTRRSFCSRVGAGTLVAIMLPGCGLGSARIETGGLDNEGESPGSSNTTGGSGAQGSSDGGNSGAAGGSPDLAASDGSISGNNPSACPSGGFDAGPASEIMTGTAKYFANEEVFVCRDAGGLYALTSVCTHTGCDVKQNGSQFWCPCHAATFDLNGEHPTPPAYSPLVHYSLCVDATGNIHVDTSTIVAPASRVVA
jgi:nitrite reductase/ring-hydroxylating ferredoxin subunit